MRTWPLLATAVSMSLCVTGCFYPADRGRLLETKVDKLNAENGQLLASLKESQDRLDKTVPKVDEKIAEVTKALEGMDRAARRSDADIGVQLQKTVEDVAQLRGQVETYLFKISELELALKHVQEDTDKKLVDLQGAEAKAAGEAKKKSDEVTRPTDPKKFLALAEEKAKAGEATVARQLFAEFLKKFPKDEGASAAHQGLADSLYAEGSCPEALYWYAQLVDKFPKAKGIPDALLHSGECLRKANNVADARRMFEAVIADFPKSDQAKTAKAKIAELEKAAKKPAPATGKAPAKAIPAKSTTPVVKPASAAAAKKATK